MSKRNKAYPDIQINWNEKNKQLEKHTRAFNRRSKLKSLAVAIQIYETLHILFPLQLLRFLITGSTTQFLLTQIKKKRYPLGKQKNKLQFMKEENQKSRDGAVPAKLQREDKTLFFLCHSHSTIWASKGEVTVKQKTSFQRKS